MIGDISKLVDKNIE